MSNQTTYKKYPIFGVDIDALTIEQATDYIVAKAADPDSKACFVTKPYVEFLDKAYREPEIVDLLENAELCLGDGVALNWAATYLYNGPHTLRRWFSTLAAIILAPGSLKAILPDRFAGTNAVWPLLEAANARGIKVFLIGSPKHHTIDHTAETIKQRLPQIKLVGTYRGNFKQASDETKLITTLKQTKPDLIMVGMGFPLQERVMSELCTILDHGVLIGEGGTFDYQSFGGKFKRAPRLMQTIGLEWLWRMAYEPSRFGRQLAIPRFMWRIYKESR
jgi:N-acetylglucosaminyldiphosphoundecaprenol N-acetyl-beta-D-mannosaminyltransferase